MKSEYIYGTFLTPQKAGNPVCGGLIYDKNKELVKESKDIRFRTIPMDDTLPIIDQSNDTYLYLNYSFSQYGHFILETLPMLSYCLEPEWNSHKKIFLPFHMNGDNVYAWREEGKPAARVAQQRSSLVKKIHSLISLLDIDLDKVHYHTQNAILKSNFIIMPKIEYGETRVPLTDARPHHKIIINKLINKLPKNLSPQKKVFIKRPSNRITKHIANEIESFCKHIGFDIVNPAKLSIFDQIKLMRETKILLGFSGSGMHNSMFLYPDSLVINLADIRDNRCKKCCIPNQKITNSISGCREHFIDFKCQDDMTTCKIKGFEMSIEQQEYYIKYLQKSIIDTINLHD